MATARGPVWFAALLLLLGASHSGAAQRVTAKGPVPSEDRSALTLALTFNSVGANITTANSFWLAGGSAELNASLVHGLGLTASITGLHTGNSGGGVPVNLIIETFGPVSYTHLDVYKRQASAIPMAWRWTAAATSMSPILTITR